MLSPAHLESPTHVLTAREPATVGRFVVPIVVDAVDRQSFLVSVVHRPAAKWLKCLPFLADPDAASAVAMPRSMFDVAASVLHAVPQMIELRVRSSMCGEALPRHLVMQTTARTVVSRSQVFTSRISNFSTVTSTRPNNRAISPFRSASDHCEPTKALSSQIYKCWHAASHEEN